MASFLAAAHALGEGVVVDTFATLIGYEFNREGRYREKVYIKSAAAFDGFMRKVVAPACVEGREVMITDVGDNAVFHVKERALLHAGGADPAIMTALLTKWGASIRALPDAAHDPAVSPSWREDTRQRGTAADAWTAGWRQRYNVHAEERAKQVQTHTIHQQGQGNEQGYGR